MCTNRNGAFQLELTIDLIDDCMAVGHRWAHKTAHASADAGYASASEKLQAAQRLLVEVRSLLDEAKFCLDEGVLVSAGVTVKRV